MPNDSTPPPMQAPRSDVRTLALLDILVLHTRIEGECWIWTRSLVHGYGQVQPPGMGSLRAHRLGWEILIGPRPPGLELDHLCERKACWNPDHLEPVTHRVNGLRSYYSRFPFARPEDRP